MDLRKPNGGAFSAWREREENSSGGGRRTNGSTATPEGRSDHQGICCGVKEARNHLEGPVAALKLENQDVKIGRLEWESKKRRSNGKAEQEGAIEENGDRTSGKSDSSARGREAAQSFLRTSLRGTYLQRDLLNEVVGEAPKAIRKPYREFILHLLQTAQTYAGIQRWSPIHSQVLRRQLSNCPSATRRLWDHKTSVIECRDKGAFNPELNWARHYRINPNFAVEFFEAGREGQPLGYDLREENKRTSRKARLNTHIQNRSGHRWGSDENRLLDTALRLLKDTDHPVNRASISRYVDALRQEVQTSAETRFESQCRYIAALSAANTIRDQTVREGNPAQIQNAYKVQCISGRLSFKQGGPQNLPRIGKALAYSDIEGVCNYDIASSQTMALRTLADDLQQLGVNVDTRPLDDYLRGGGKDRVATSEGLPRPLVKQVEHAVKFGGTIPHSLAQADFYSSPVDGRMPAIVEGVQRYYPDEDETDQVLKLLRRIFGPMEKMIADLTEGLLGPYWKAHRRPGGRGKGATMRNACAITFTPYDYAEGHERRSKAMAWYLQGLEAAYVHAVTGLSRAFSYTVFANEHDGCITLGKIPEEAKRKAREMSGFEEAELVEKPLVEKSELRAFCEKHDIPLPERLVNGETL